jgi:hypothetical protein
MDQMTMITRSKDLVLYCWYCGTVLEQGQGEMKYLWNNEEKKDDDRS